MHRALKVMSAGSWASDKEVATVTLAFDDRHRRRLKLEDDGGVPFLLDLEKAARLKEGDGLALADGGIIRVIAASEPVADLTLANARELARLAWHIGNRHTPVEVRDERTLRIRDDHILIDMATRLGARADRLNAPFSPEEGAYAEGGGHGHSHGH